MQDQDNQKNLVIAIVLSMAVLFGWQFFYAAPKEQERQSRIRQEQAAKAKEQAPPAPSATPDAPGTSAKPDQARQPGAVPTPGDQAAIVTTRQGAIDAGPRVGISTPSLKGSIALKGGRIDDVVLARYRELVAPKSPSVELFSPSGSPHPYYAEFGWTAGKDATQPMPDGNTLWRAETEGPLTPQSPVTLAWDNGQGLVFRRTIAVDTNYLFTVTDDGGEQDRQRRLALPLRPDLPPRPAQDRRRVDGPARGIHRCARRQRTQGGQLRRRPQGGRHQDLQADRRLAGLHR